MTERQDHVSAWHFTDGRVLRDGRKLPRQGAWLKHEGDVEMCVHGLHASRRIIDALRYAPGTLLHQVECRDIVEEQTDKLVCRQRRIVRTVEVRDLLVRFAKWCATRARHAAHAAYAAHADAAAHAAAYAYDAAANAVDAADAAAQAAAADADAAREKERVAQERWLRRQTR